MCQKTELIKSEVIGQKSENAFMVICMMVLCLSIFLPSQAFAQKKSNITLLIGVSDSYKVSKAISEVVKMPEVASSYNFCFYTNEDVEDTNIDREIVTQSEIIVVDIMYRSLAEYVLKNANFEKTKVYGVHGAVKSDKIYLTPK